jgi:RNA polymerase sigma-70 factor (ECF subfamily)
MHPQHDEKMLLQQAQAGDTQALSTLYEHYVDSVYRFMFYRTGDTMAAEDLTAEVFANVLTAIQHYKDRGIPFKAWLFRIARARLADYWRTTERQEKYQHIIAEYEVKQSESSAIEDRFEHEYLQQAFQYLTPAESEVVVLRFAGGLNHKEIALIIHSNANAVKSKMRRALKKLRRILESQENAAYNT